MCDAGVCGLNGDPITLIAFVSGRDNTAAIRLLTAEIYLMNPDGTNPVRLTNNVCGDSMPSLSPNGKGTIVFDSNRLRTPSEPLNTSDLFLMKHDGSDQTFLTRGSSATWSPDSQRIAFHRSASGTGLPIKADPGAPTSDSDIFVASVCDLLAGVPPTNITNSATEIDDDAAWSPDGQKILWTPHNVGDNPLNPLRRNLGDERGWFGAGQPDQQRLRGAGSHVVSGWHAHGVHVQDRTRPAERVPTSRSA